MTGRTRSIRVLVISSAYDGASAAVLHDAEVQAETRIAEEHGLAAALPGKVAELLARTGRPDLVACVVGPGSFTGLRAGLSVAAGIALGSGVPAIGVTVAEALAEAASGLIDGRELWTCIIARRNRVTIDVAGVLAGFDTDALPPAAGRVAVCGNAANIVAGALAARGADVMLTPVRAPALGHVAAVALRRMRGDLPPVAMLPLYVEAPSAVPSRDLRPAPAGAVC